MMNVKIENMTSPRSERPVANQFIIYVGKSVYFQSYRTVIACISEGITYLDNKKWDCSRTTSRYRNNFLGETTKETQRKIDSGEYKLIDLNEEK
jgi:hypothetical protein